MHHKLLLSGFLIVVTGFLSACENAPQHPDPLQQPQTGLWNSEDCVVACWQGLSPGLSSEETVEAFFQDHLLPTPGVFSGQQDNFNWYTGSVQIDGEEYYPRIRAADGLLQSIWLQGPFNLTLEQVLARFGEPQLLEVGVFLYGAESSVLEGLVYLHYPESGFSFRSYHWGGNIADSSLEICLQPDYLVYDFFVYKSLPISEFVPEEQNIHNDLPNLIQRDWQGYDCFNQGW